MTFPALSVGLAIFLVICYGAYYKTGNPLYLQMFRFWRNIFAIGFALGIVSGIVLTFELGLNWGNYARAVGPILGPMICVEALMAFFLEAGFFGILVWGGPGKQAGDDGRRLHGGPRGAAVDGLDPRRELLDADPDRHGQLHDVGLPAGQADHG